MPQPDDVIAQVVVILGATSAMARATANAFAAAGHTIVLGGRDLEELEILAQDIATRYEARCLALRFDALEFQEHENFLKLCEAATGQAPDGLVVFFGYMTDQEIAQRSFEEAQRTVDVNLTAVISICEPFATLCEHRRRGFVAVVSSVAGDRGRQSNYIYGASKAGLSAYLQGLRNRMFKHNTCVTTIKPGFVDTRMTFGLPLPKPLVASPEVAGRAIYRAIIRGRNEAYVPFFWRYIMLLIRNIPEAQFKKMKL